MPKVDDKGNCGIYMKIPKKANDIWVSMAKKRNVTKTQVFLDWLESDS